MQKHTLWLLIAAGVLAYLALPALFPGNSRLYEAIWHGDTAEVERLLADGADPNDRSSGLSGLGSGFEPSLQANYAPLLYAIYRNEAGSALALVNAGADPDRRNPKGDTALMAAAEQGMSGVVRALLARGADPLAENPHDGSTALYLGRAFDVQGNRALKTHLAPDIRELLQAAVNNRGQ